MKGENEGKSYKPLPPGGYETVPLAHDEIKAAACQMVTEPVDTDHPEPGIQRNVEVMLGLIDNATAQGCQLMVFPEFALNRGPEPAKTELSRDEGIRMKHNTLVNPREKWLKGAIKVPGPETAIIGAKAKQLGCYVSFSSYTQEPDEWPGHFFNASLIIGPSGDIIYNHWKNYWGYPGIGTEYATRVYDVLEEFIEKYGWDAVWPVAKTPIGNLAGYVCSEGHQSETARILTFYGAEIFCRNYAGGGKGSWGGRFRTGFLGDCAQNLCWGIYSNAGTSAHVDPEKSWAGGSMIVSPYGQILAEAKSLGNEVVFETIPIAEFRTGQNRYDGYNNPHMSAGCLRGGVRTELVIPVYQQFPGQFPPNLLSKYQEKHGGELPPDCKTTREWYFKNARWELPYHDPAEYI